MKLQKFPERLKKRMSNGEKKKIKKTEEYSSKTNILLSFRNNGKRNRILKEKLSKTIYY